MRFLEKVSIKTPGMVQGSSEYVLIEIKSLFSIILTHLAPYGETAYHSHAFNAFTIFLKGTAMEFKQNQWRIKTFPHDGRFKFTRRSDCHMLETGGTGAWFLTFRGPWRDTWQEVQNGKVITLTHGRKEI